MILAQSKAVSDNKVHDYKKMCRNKVYIYSLHNIKSMGSKIIHDTSNRPRYPINTSILTLKPVLLRCLYCTLLICAKPKLYTGKNSTVLPLFNSLIKCFTTFEGISKKILNVHSLHVDYTKLTNRVYK